MRLVAPIIAALLCSCTICAFLLIQAGRAAWERSGDISASLAAAIESDIVRNVESFNLSLQRVISKLKQLDTEHISPELRQLVLFDHSATDQNVGAILVLDENGRLRFDSRRADPMPLDLSGRDYFKAHQDNNPSVLYVGQPQALRSSGAFLVGISRRLSKPDGSFAGVVAGTIQLNHFKKLFKDISPGAASTIALAHTDGTILMRWPFDESAIGHNTQQTEIFQHLAQSRSGRFESFDVTDGVRRLVAYNQLSDLPIVISVGQSTEDIYAPWRKYALTIGLLIATLCMLSALFSIHLLRDLRSRDATERKLVTLATIDGLTGVSNRWHFNETIHREWQRAQQTQSTLALLMIDADQFKVYNDRHGHQAGDGLLKAIGAAISASIRRGTDLGARFGGDEFAVLLPGTPLATAARVADQIRNQFIADCGALHMDDARISVGVACLVPAPSTPHSALLAAADGALYRAKQLGRDRIEVADAAPVPSTEPMLVRHRAA